MSNYQYVTSKYKSLQDFWEMLHDTILSIAQMGTPVNVVMD